MTGEGGSDDPAVDPDDVFDGVPVTDVDELLAAGVDDPAESLVASFEDDVVKAIQSATWHTIVDGAGSESFVDDLTVGAFREAIQELNAAGYATDGLSPGDIRGAGDPPDEGAAFFVGDDAADQLADLSDEAVRLREDDVDETGDQLPGIDGYTVERTEGVPSNLIVFVDVKAIARVPPEARSVPVGLDSTPTVSSPVVVRDEDGIAVVNLAP